MFGVRQEFQSSPFVGVRFALFGFDPQKHAEVRLKLVNGGGVDGSRLDCTHVIVDKLVYDDPLCVAVRSEGKVVVTSLWVDHSLDVGMQVDASSVMYKPVRDLNGILGAKDLIMCLTGYQRQDRDDIMQMVNLMGAQFSKPLVANKVTHLICYKFEGEKYELAKRMKRIKLVNHRWLEDCLKSWEILPEENYTKSGYELEMEIEAKDSEGETEAFDGALIRGRNTDASPRLQDKKPGNHGTLVIGEMVPNTGPVGLQNVCNRKGVTSVINKEIKSDQATESDNDRQKDQLAQRYGDAGGVCDAKSANLSYLPVRVPSSNEVELDVPSISGSAKRLADNDAAKFSALGYSRRTPRGPSLTLQPGTGAADKSGSLRGHLVENKDHGGSPISEIDKGKEKSYIAEAPLIGTDQHNEVGLNGSLPQKRKIDVHLGASSPSSKSQKLSVSTGKEIDATVTTVHTSGSCGINKHLSLDPLGGLITDAAVTLGSAQKAPASVPANSHFNQRLEECNLPISRNLTSEMVEGSNLNNEAPQISVGGLRSPVAHDHSTKNADKTAISVGKMKGEQQNEQQNDAISSPVKDPEVAKSWSPKSLVTPMQRKTIAKKTLGSRPKLNIENAANQKGSIFLSGVSSVCNAAMNLVSKLGAVDHDKSSNSVNPEKGLQINDLKSGNEVYDNSVLMDDETEAPPEFEKVESEKKCKPAELSDVAGADAEQHATDKAEVLVQIAHEDAGILNKKEKPGQGALVKTTSSKEGFQKMKKAISTRTKNKSHPSSQEVVDPKMPVDGELVECVKHGKKAGIEKKKSVFHPAGNPGKKSPATVDVFEPKSHGEQVESVKNRKKTGIEKKKRVLDPAGGAGKKSCPASVDKPKMPVDGEQVEGVKNGKEVGKEKKRRVLHPTGSAGSGTLLVRKSEGPLEAEKENEQDVNNYPNASKGGKLAGKLNSKSIETAQKCIQKGVSSDSLQKRDVSSVLKREPAWFILSGHRLQRKEFRQVIQCLKGRLCRDSHQWSYQATHFIVPDPIRRTEKFFGAAASGRWILKTDYLTASNEAGSFLPEEPYEWHKNGLTEDGAINLEAPRKWRLLRERTGHGALYGMKIIIYGECIAPPLDTLKRVVKAGDGTILATSPPYTRFLKSGVDFAIVSPGMPRVDMWVQEFLRHEIPCVLADYLVEYVCKPGYSLERHVQYNTHEWAAKSLANLLSCSEEVIEDPASSPDNQVSDDLSCQVCGCSDRGEVMLICGNESGSTGCGIGTHIDCCNPPLEGVPEEDWFCPKCTSTKTPPPRCNEKWGLPSKTKNK
ncbi:hypothetical protein Ancab_022476 [Ancistrocladus abbreviatus]